MTKKTDRELTHIVYFADLIISRFYTGIEIDRLNTNNFNNRLPVSGLASNEFVNLVNAVSLKDVIN